MTRTSCRRWLVPRMLRGVTKSARLARRELIAYHEAGHAVVGHHQGLTFGVVYVGDVGGQVLFDAQWKAEDVLHDPDLLDRYGLMLLAPVYVEQRRRSGVLGAGSDVATLARMIGVAERTGVEPRADVWERAERQVAERWDDIEALADELIHRSSPVEDLAAVLASYPELGRSVDELMGARALEVLATVGKNR